MAHFPDQLRVLVEEGGVTLSIRSAENKVDEYAFDRSLFENLVEAIDWDSQQWVGPPELQLKLSSSGVTLAIEILPWFKREVHRIGLAEFKLMLAGYYSQAKGS